MNPCLDAKLLAICRVASRVRAPGVFTDDSADFAECGFLDLPVSVIGGPDGINAALVGKIAEGTVVCYRGTLSPDDETRTVQQRIFDWAQDFEAVLALWAGPPHGLICHLGFATALDSIRSTFGGEDSVIFTGHSKGGAMAQLAALRHWEMTRRPVRCVTFGAPRAGGVEFQGAIEASGVSITRYENAGDIVPHVPLCPRLAKHLGLPVRQIDFRSVGSLAYVDSGEVVRPADLYEELQVYGSAIAQLARSIAGGPKAIRDAHSIDRRGGYWNAVHPEQQRWLD